MLELHVFWQLVAKRFVGTCCLHLQGRIFNIETISLNLKYGYKVWTTPIITGSRTSQRMLL